MGSFEWISSRGGHVLALQLGGGEVLKGFLFVFLSWALRWYFLKSAFFREVSSVFEHTLEFVLHPSPNKPLGLHAVQHVLLGLFPRSRHCGHLQDHSTGVPFEVILFAQRWWTPCVAWNLFLQDVVSHSVFLYWQSRTWKSFAKHWRVAHVCSSIENLRPSKPDLKWFSLKHHILGASEIFQRIRYLLTTWVWHPPNRNECNKKNFKHYFSYSWFK